MSAWGIGSSIGLRQSATFGTREEKQTTLDAVVRWIPGEVVTAFSAVMLAFQPESIQNGNGPIGSVPEAGLVITSGWWLVFFAGLTAGLTFFGAWSKTPDLDPQAERELWWSIPLSIVAFVIWSFVITGSWWYSFDSLRQSSHIVPIVAGVVGVLFGLLADGVMLRVRSSAQQRVGRH